MRPLPAGMRSLRALLLADGVAAARLLDAGHGSARYLLGWTSTTSYLDCPRCHMLVPSDHRTTRLVCPWCRETVCEVVGSL